MRTFLATHWVDTQVINALFRHYSLPDELDRPRAVIFLYGTAL